jgi:hypothetical protein
VKVHLECADDALGHVAAVYVRRNKLELAAPLLSDGEFVCGAHFIVKGLEVNRAAVKFESLHDAVVGSDALAIVTGLEGFDQDHVAVGVVRPHEVVVAAAGTVREVAHVISIELADWLNDDKELLGLLGRELTGGVKKGFLCVQLGLVGAHALS